MKPDDPIYSVTHVRTKKEAGREYPEIRECRWFETKAEAEAHFKGIKLEVTVYTNDPDIPASIIIFTECKRLYQVGQSEDAKARIIEEPKYDAERLAIDLDIDPNDGILLAEVSSAKFG